MPATFDRMIFWELLRVFLLSIIGLTGLWVVVFLAQSASQMGLSPSQMLSVIPLTIPTGLPYTIPMTILFASCVTCGRLTHDNELVAMKAAGVDVLRVYRPVFAIGLLGTAATLVLSNTIIPRSLQQIRAEVLRDPEEVMYNLLRREKHIKAGSETPYSVFVRDVQGRRLIDVVIKEKSTKPVDLNGPLTYYEYVVRTKEAKLTVNLDEGPQGMVTIDSDSWVGGNKSSTFETKNGSPYKIPLPDNYSGKKYLKTQPSALERDELNARIEEYQREKSAKLQAREDNRLRGESTTDLAQRERIFNEDKHYAAQLNEIDRKIRNAVWEKEYRPALAFGCLCFALVGCPVGIWANRADYLSSFIICFIPSVLIYYVMLLSGRGLALDGKLPILLTAWMPNVVMATASLLLTWRLIRR